MSPDTEVWRNYDEVNLRKDEKMFGLTWDSKDKARTALKWQLKTLNHLRIRDDEDQFYEGEIRQEEHTHYIDDQGVREILQDLDENGVYSILDRKVEGFDMYQQVERTYFSRLDERRPRNIEIVWKLDGRAKMRGQSPVGKNAASLIANTSESCYTTDEVEELGSILSRETAQYRSR